MDSKGKSQTSKCWSMRMWYRRQYHILVERCLPLSNWKSIFSRLFERSAEVLALYSGFHSSLSRGGKLISLGLSFIARWTVLPYLESEHGVLQEHPYLRLASGQRNYNRVFEGSEPSWFIFRPALQIGTPSFPMVKSSLYFLLIPRFSFKSMKGWISFLRQYK